MTETELQAALDHAHMLSARSKSMDVTSLTADVQALVAEVKRLQYGPGLMSELADRGMFALSAECDQLRARVAELEPRYTGDQVLARARQAGFDEAREMAARQCERVTAGEHSEYNRGYFAALSHVEKDIRAMQPRGGSE